MKGLNRKDEWSKKKSWRPAGEIVFEHVPELPPSSLVYPIWERVKQLLRQKQSYEAAVQQELNVQQTTKEKVKVLANAQAPTDFPWKDVENSFEYKIGDLTQERSKLIPTLGREFRSSGQLLGDKPTELEQVLVGLEVQERNIEGEIAKLLAGGQAGLSPT